MTIEREISSNAPALVVRTQGSDRSLEAGRSYSIGRNPESDIVVDEARVSWRHAVLRLEGATWLLEDVGSTNGTFLGAQRVQRVEITEDCVLRLGHPDDGQRLWCSVVAPRPADGGRRAGRRDPADGGVQPRPRRLPAAAARPRPRRPRAAGARACGRRPAGPPPAPAGLAAVPAARRAARLAALRLARRRRPPTRTPAAGSSSIAASRARSCGCPPGCCGSGAPPTTTVVVSDLSVSRYHAELRRSSRGGYEIVDLGSHNGTYVNGQRVTSAPVTEADIIGIGPATFRLVGQELQEFIDTGDVSLNVQDLTVRMPGGKVLLDDVSFPLGERCLLGVIGPSGAGKSTLLGALTGMKPATEGPCSTTTATSTRTTPS